MEFVRVTIAATAIATALLAPNPTLTTRILTPDGADTYSITQANGTVTTTAPTTNTGSTLRAVFWPTSALDLDNSRVCITWATQSAPSVQEGTVHHVTVLPDRVRAVTLTKNVIYDIFWVFNVHVWDTTQNPAFAQVAQFDMIDVMFRPDGTYQLLPWRVCTEMIGATLRFKIWFPNVMAEPAWSDARYARSATVPAGWVTRGKSGGYVGHVPPGGRATYTAWGVWSL